MNSAKHPAPRVSIIIPTHNREHLLAGLLRALERQDGSLNDTEIIIIADGCQDGTMSMLKSLPSLPLRILELPGLGPAEARNRGADAARGSLFLFLDDDVLATKGLLQAHVVSHLRHPGAVVLGPYPPFPHATGDPFRLAVRKWWTEHFAALAEPGHRITYKDVLTGNISIPAEVWHSIGGLDPQFRRAHEDYELGIRLIAAGVPIVFAPEALAHHYEHETMTLRASLRRKFEEARSDVVMARKHPHIRPDIDAVRCRLYESSSKRLLDRLAFTGGAGMDRIAQLAEAYLPALERSGLRSTYGTVVRMLMSYWYIRGLSTTFTSFRDWQDFAQERRQTDGAVGPTLDLRPGLEAAEAALDRLRPMTAKLAYGGRPIGRLPPGIGAEPWKGAHLRPALMRICGPAYLRALVADGAVPDLRVTESGHVARALNSKSAFFGLRRPPDAWAEQAHQWKVIEERSRKIRAMVQEAAREPREGPASAELSKVPSAEPLRPGGDR